MLRASRVLCSENQVIEYSFVRETRRNLENWCLFTTASFDDQCVRVDCEVHSRQWGMDKSFSFFKFLDMKMRVAPVYSSFSSYIHDPKSGDLHSSFLFLTAPFPSCYFYAHIQRIHGTIMPGYVVMIEYSSWIRHVERSLMRTVIKLLALHQGL